MNNLLTWWRRRRARRDARLLNLLRAHPGGLLARDISQQLSWPFSSVLAHLTRLEKEGRVISQWTPGPSVPGPSRRVYLHAMREQKRIW